MKIIYSNIIRVDDPTNEMLTWCENNLVLLNPEYDMKNRMGLWTGNIPEMIELYTSDSDGLILPYGILGRLYAQFKYKADWINGFPVPESEHYKLSLVQNPGFINAKVPLYDYQETAVREMVNSKMGILQAPAGSGKTQIGIALAIRIGKRTLWIVHTRDLLKQAYERTKLYMLEELLGIISEGSVNIGDAITFATIQTLSKTNLSEYQYFWDTVIVDECHRVSGSFTTVTMYQKVLNTLVARHKYGLSATVHRSDGLIQSTYALLGTVKYKVRRAEVADKIMQVSVCQIDTGVWGDDGYVFINYTKYINKLVRDLNRNKIIVKVAINSGRGHSCLFLSDRLKHLETLIQMLPKDMTKDAVMIMGKMTNKKDKAMREQAIEDMRNRKKKYLFASYNLAKEGLDIPCLDRLYLTTPHKDYAVITQSIGRIARTYKGKNSPIVYDFVDEDNFAQKCWAQRQWIYGKNKCSYIGQGERIIRQ